MKEKVKKTVQQKEIRLICIFPERESNQPSVAKDIKNLLELELQQQLQKL